MKISPILFLVSSIALALSPCAHADDWDADFKATAALSARIAQILGKGTRFPGHLDDGSPCTVDEDLSGSSATVQINNSVKNLEGIDMGEDNDIHSHVVEVSDREMFKATVEVTYIDDVSGQPTGPDTQTIEIQHDTKQAQSVLIGKVRCTLTPAPAQK